MANYPHYELSAAPEVIALARRARLLLDPWQQFVLTHGLGMDALGQYAARRVSCWVPRQNGKGGIIEALELAWLFHFKVRFVIHSAHEQSTSMQAYRRMEDLIRGVPALHRLVRPYGDKEDKPGYRKSHSEQMIELHDGRMLQYRTRTKSGARGFSTPNLVLDEAQELTADQIASIMPVLSAQPNYQAWFFGTPPLDPEAWCYGLRADGETGVERLAHFDWGAGTFEDTPAVRALVEDPETAWAANPAMGIRIAPDTVEDERRPSGLGEKFPYERLGMWRAHRSANSAIDINRWRELADVASRRDGDVMLGVDVSLDRDWAAIVVYGHTAAGLGHLQVVSYDRGTEWLVDRLRHLRDVVDPIGVAMGNGTYLSLREALGAAGFRRSVDPLDEIAGGRVSRALHQRGDVVVPSSQEMAAACGQIIDAVRQESFRYVPSAELDRAAINARVRNAGDGIAWSRTDRLVDVSPWVAATLARWAFYSVGPALVNAGNYDPANDIW